MMLVTVFCIHFPLSFLKFLFWSLSFISLGQRSHFFCASVSLWLLWFTRNWLCQTYIYASSVLAFVRSLVSFRFGAVLILAFGPFLGPTSPTSTIFKYSSCCFFLSFSSMLWLHGYCFCVPSPSRRNDGERWRALKKTYVQFEGKLENNLYIGIYLTEMRSTEKNIQSRGINGTFFFRGCCY